MKPHFFIKLGNIASQLIICLAILALIYALIRTVLGIRRSIGVPRTRRPGAIRPPGRWTRFTEAFALALIGGTVLILCVTSTHSGGYLLQLEELRPESRLEYLGVMAMAALAVLGSVGLVAGSGRTGLGTLFMAGTLAIYGAYLNMGDQTRWLKQRRGHFKNDQTKREMTFEFRLVRDMDGFDFNFEGADFWLNGVYLGKTPVRISTSELKRRVPHWDDKPMGYQDQALRFTKVTPWSKTQESYPQWFRVHVSSHDLNTEKHEAVLSEDYNAQAKIEGGPGYATGSMTGGGSDLMRMDVGATFPQAEARLSRLLAQARLKDYAVDAAWIRALDRFGESGWNLLAHLAQKEPGFEAIRQQRIATLFGLGSLKTPEQNWSFFERVMNEADRLGVYDTDTTVGQAIALVAPHLDPERLAALAEKIIPRHDLIVAAYNQGRGRVDFGAVRIIAQGSQRMARSERFNMMLFNGGSDPFPPRAFVIAHAIQAAQEQLKARDSNRPTVFETRVAPQILRWFYRSDHVLRIAAMLGGPEVDRFLMRQDWSRPYFTDQNRYEDRLLSMGMGDDVNKWFYLLITRTDGYGRAFRRAHTDLILSLADKLTQRENLSMQPDLLDFLFLDPDLGERSAGFQYWPRYRTRVLGSHEVFALEMLYLVRLEPLATPQMYAQAVRDMCEAVRSRNVPFYIYGMFNFRRDMANLVPPRQLAALQALAAEVNRGLAALSGKDHDSREEFLYRTQKELKQLLMEAGDPESIDSLVAELTPANARARREEISIWLEQAGNPPGLLLERLAKAEEPELRRMALASIRKMPTRENRELLARLLGDRDAGVRQAAKETREELARLGRGEGE